MKTTSFVRTLVVIGLFLFGAGASQAAMTSHFTFDDAGNGGLSLLKAAFGSDASVRGGNPAVDINGLGSLMPTNGEGRADGTGAIAIPKGQFLAVPHGLAQTTGSRWFVRMRVTYPVAEWHAFLSLSADNTTDAFIHGGVSGGVGSNAHWGGYSGSLQPGDWHTIVLSCDGTKTSLYLDGTWQRDTISAAPRTQGTDLTGLATFNVSADNDGEDGLLFVDDLIIGSGTYEEYEENAVEIPLTPAAKTYTGAALSYGLTDTDDYTVTAEGNCTDRGFHAIRLALRAPETKFWIDGTTADKILYFAIRDGILFPELRVHYDFNDAGNGGLNLLKATVGSDAVVRTGSNPATDVDGIGSLYAVSGEGRTDGTGAIAIPVGQFLAFDHRLTQAAGTKYDIEFRLLTPAADPGWKSIFMLDAENNSGDATLLNRNLDNVHYRPGSGSYFDWNSPTLLTVDTWNTVSLLCDGASATFLVNGQRGADSTYRSYLSYQLIDLTGIPTFGISGDDNGEDHLMWFDDIKVYGEGAAVPVVPPADSGLFYATGEAQLLVTNARTYAVKGSAYGTAAGTYPITVGLLDPATTTWSDGSSTDRVVTVTIAAHPNAWEREPAVGVTTWTEDEVVPAVDPGKSAYGTPVVYLDGSPYDAAEPLAAGAHTFTVVVPLTAEGTLISKTIPVTVLASGSAKPVSITAAAYVTNGLSMLLDGKDNAGFGRHDGAATLWKDLSGNGYDWTIDSTCAAWQADGLKITGGTATAAAGTQAAAKSFDNMISATEFIWKTDTMKEGIIFGPGWASRDYLFTDEKGSVSFYNKLGVSASEGVANAYSVNYVRSETIARATGLKDVTVDGAAATTIGTDYFPSGMDVEPLIGNRRQYGLPALGELRTLRFYAKNLTADERAINLAVDYRRYGVGAMPAALATDGYRLEDGEVLVRFDLAVRKGAASVNGGAAARTQTLWLPLGSTVTVQTDLTGVTPERASAFVRTGLPSETVYSADGQRFTFSIERPTAAEVSHPDARSGVAIIVR